MAILTLGKFEITPTTGNAGDTDVAVKYVTQHTGRANYVKYVKNYMTNDVSKYKTVTITAVAKPVFMTLAETTKSLAWNTENTTVSIATNAEKFRISATGATVTLGAGATYTVAELIGTFNSNLGLNDQHSPQISIGLPRNTSASERKIAVKIEYWDGTTYVVAGTFTVTQSSADSGISITANPTTIPTFYRGGETKKISITANAAYSIVESNGTDISWLSLSRTSGVAGTADLSITVTPQVVAASARSTQVNFKNPVSGSVLLTLNINQEAGAVRSIMVSTSAISFAQDEVSQIKTFQVTANDDFYLEEASGL